MATDEITSAKIVVIGGGTGSFTLLSGLKHYVRDISALVNMADDGGSTGTLRDELGVLPPGDVRQCLVALSQSPKVRDLFNYRFDKGGLKGHAFGNLFLTALEKMTGSFAEAVELASQVLNIHGRVHPATLSNVTLCAEGADGQPVRGEFTIGQQAQLAAKPEIWLEPDATANPAAVQAIQNANMVVVAPGDLYGSLAPVLVIDEIRQALHSTRATCVFVCNLVTKPGPTHQMSVLDFTREIERLAGGEFLDYVVYNNGLPPQELMARYEQEDAHLVRHDAQTLARHQSCQFIGAPILSRTLTQRHATSSDPIAESRSFIRHDPDLVARQLMRIYFS
ncbi:MAG: YvcK family protein [Lautropia sp.]|nr:YvcK family protein [Lautropia sp.]